MPNPRARKPASPRVIKPCTCSPRPVTGFGREIRRRRKSIRHIRRAALPWHRSCSSPRRQMRRERERERRRDARRDGERSSPVGLESCKRSFARVFVLSPAFLCELEERERGYELAEIPVHTRRVSQGGLFVVLLFRFFGITLMSTSLYELRLSFSLL